MRNELRRIFVEEATRRLAECADLLAIRGRLGPEAIEALFRHLHSIKGMAASLGHGELAEAAHALEDRAAALRKGGLREDPATRDLLRSGIDHLRDLVRRLAGDPPAPRGRAAPAPRPPAGIDPGRLDRLLEIALSVSASFQRLEHRLAGHEDQVLLALERSLAEGIRAFRREVLEMRLAPVRWLVPLLARSLERWAAERGLTARLEVRGDAIRADRLVLERLVSPLAHLARNAVVHGLEPPAERRAAGKPEAGLLRLEVSSEGDRLRIVLEDDGRGIPPEVAAEVARGRSLVDILSSPRFSTREEADLLAGRGVGLGAVRADIEALGGTLELRSEPGHGFRAELHLPARLTILDAFLAETGGQRLIVPAGPVAAVLEDSPEDLPELELPGLPGGPACLLLEVPGRRGILRVERVVDRREVIVRPLGPPLASVTPFVGAAFLAEGSLALVLEPARLAPRVPAPA